MRMRGFANNFLLLLTFLLLLAKPSGASATWNQVAQFTNRVSAVFFLDRDNGFVGFYGSTSTVNLQMTNDGGATWRVVNTPAFLALGNVWISDIWFYNRLEGWATFFYSSTGSNLWHTVDGGLNWSNAGFSGNPCAVRQTTHAVVVTQWGGVPGINASVNNGATFTRNVGPTTDGLDFVDDLRGATAGFGSKFYYTSDGGLSWNLSQTNFTSESWGIYGTKNTPNFLAAPEETAATSTGSQVYTSTDYGVNWLNITTLPFKTNGDVKGAGSTIYVQNAGTLGGTTGLFRTTDNGQTWVSVGGPNNYYDGRFAVVDCGNVLYAADYTGGLFKSIDAGDGHVFGNCPVVTAFTNLDSLRQMTSNICDSLKHEFYLHNIFGTDTVALLDLRIWDTLRKPAKSGAIHFDSIPHLYHLLLPHDSMGFSMGWIPRLLSDTSVTDSTKLRVIYYIPRIGKFDTIYLSLQLIGLSVRPNFFLSSTGMKLDSIPTCITRDTTLDVWNTGCDTITITSAFLQVHKDWTLTDSLGKPITLPMRVLTGRYARFGLHFTPHGFGSSIDTVRLRLHQVGRDTAAAVGLRGSARYSYPIASVPAMQFDSTATCISIDSSVVFRNAGCDTLFLTQADLLSLDWSLFDKNGQPLKFPIPIAPNDSNRLSVHFAPHNIGGTSGRIVMHFRYLGFDSTRIVTLTGAGKATGTLEAQASLDLGSVSTCTQIDTTITFRNSTCGKLLLDSVSIGTPFELLDTLQLPTWLDAGKSLTLHIRYAPHKQETVSSDMILKEVENGVITYRQVQIFAKGVAGSSSFRVTPKLDSLQFAPRTECGSTDSLVYLIWNQGCDTLRVQQIALQGSLAPSIAINCNKSLPRALASGDSLRIVVAITQLVPGNYRGGLHVQYRLADGSLVDTTYPVSASIAKGTRTLDLDTTNIDFGTVLPCITLDTTIIISNRGCLAMQVFTRTLTGNGFTLQKKLADPITLQPGESDTMHLLYDGTGSGAVHAVLNVTTDADVTASRKFAFSLVAVPSDSVRMVVRLSMNRAKAGDIVDLFVSPDRLVKNRGLHSVRGVLEYFGDALHFVSASGMAGTTFINSAPQYYGTTAHMDFVISNPADLVLDPSVPLMTAHFEVMISDSERVRMTLDSLRTNDQDPNYGSCVLRALPDTSSPSLDMILLCGDSVIIRKLRGEPLLSAEPIHPNPVTSATAFQTGLSFIARENGEAEIVVEDMLGRTISSDHVRLTASKKIDYRFNGAALSAGTYFYRIHFTSTEPTANSSENVRGSLLIIK
jgi:hypothetical protein